MDGLSVWDVRTGDLEYISKYKPVWGQVCTALIQLSPVVLCLQWEHPRSTL